MIQRNRAWRRRNARYAAEEAAHIINLRPLIEARQAAEASNPNASHHHPHANVHDLRLFWSTEQERREAA